MSFRYIYRCERCGALRFKDEPMHFCKCGGKYSLIFDDDDRAKYPYVRVENGVAYFKVRCAHGHWHFAPYVGGRVNYDLCPYCGGEPDTVADVKNF